MSPHFDQAWVANLLSTERAMLAPPEGLLAAAGARRGSTIADVGCGPGFFALPAAEIVGDEGPVFAVDVEARMLELVEHRAEERGLSNITVVLAKPHSVPLPDEAADVVVCALVLHEVDPPSREHMAAELARVCRPGGALLVVEFEPDPANTRWNRLQPVETTALLRSVGLDVRDVLSLGAVARPGHNDESMYRVIADKQVLRHVPRTL